MSQFVLRDAREIVKFFSSLTGVYTGAATCRPVRPETLGILHHDHLPLPQGGVAVFPDHADRGAPRPPRVAVDEWRSTS